MLDKSKNNSRTIQDDRPWLHRARARREDNAATMALKKAIKRKAETVAALKKFGMAVGEE
jgi:hypothetical protein